MCLKFILGYHSNYYVSKYGEYPLKTHPESVLRIYLIIMRIRILDPHWKNWIQVISIKFTKFF